MAAASTSLTALARSGPVHVTPARHRGRRRSPAPARLRTTSRAVAGAVGPASTWATVRDQSQTHGAPASELRASRRRTAYRRDQPRTATSITTFEQRPRRPRSAARDAGVAAATSGPRDRESRGASVHRQGEAESRCGGPSRVQAVARPAARAWRPARPGVIDRHAEQRETPPRRWAVAGCANARSSRSPTGVDPVRAVLSDVQRPRRRTERHAQATPTPRPHGSDLASARSGAGSSTTDVATRALVSARLREVDQA